MARYMVVFLLFVLLPACSRQTSSSGASTTSQAAATATPHSPTAPAIQSTVSPSSPEVTPTRTPASLTGAALVSALREGGYVIYFRHGATDRGGVDSIDLPPEQQRNLSDQGIAEAKAIGEAFRALNIPVGRVLASPFARTMDTAQLAFGRAEATPELLGLLSDEAGREERVAALRRFLSTAPQPGTNTILSAHQSNLQQVAGLGLPEGGAAIFRPLAPDNFELVATLLPDDWITLAQTISP